MYKKKTIIFILSLFGIIFSATTIHGLSEPTHELINRVAAERSHLDQYLKDHLGFRNGINEKINGFLIVEWISLGGRYEDVPPGSLPLDYRRAFNHFHNPLLPWSEAGLNKGLLRGMSSVYWAQNPEQRPGGRWSWRDARGYYYTALTGRDSKDNTRIIALSRKEREAYFTYTFRALGQVMHLIEDASVPAHVRNDIHPLGFLFGDYEYWVERQHKGSGREVNFIRQYLSYFIAYDVSILNIPIADSNASVSIARIFDADKYLGDNPDVTLGTAIGIAEFTNANFFSDDTIFRNFPFPRRESGEWRPPEPSPKTGKLRRYFRKTRDGERIDHLAAEGVFTRFIPDFVPESIKNRSLVLDDRVHLEYGTILLPRAVGYSAGLLNYFFRGRFDVDMVPNEADPSQSDLKVTNRSPEAVGPGTLSLYYDDSNDNRSKLAEWSLLDPVPKDGELPPITFTPQLGAERYILVYKGKLGKEEGAVIGKVFGKKVGVEEVFYDWGLKKWILRNAVGLYVLDFDAFLPGKRLYWVKWGDQDNHIIGITPSGWNTPNVFYIFRIKRPEGSLDVPITGARIGELDVVDLELVGSASLGDLNLDTGTTINLNVVHHYRQYLPSYEYHSYFKWIKTGSRPEDGYYFLDRWEFKSEKVEVAYSSDPSHTTSFHVILDPEHNLYFGSSIRPYYWWLWGFYLNRKGEVILLINVVPYVSLPDEFYQVPYYRHTPTGAIAPVDPPTYAYFSPGIPELGMLVLVNLSRKALIGKTSQDAISLSLESSSYSYGYRYGYWSTTYLDRHAFDHYEGGPNDGKVEDKGWSSSSFYNTTPSGTILEKANYTVEEGTKALSLQGLYGQDLEAAFSPPSLSTTQKSYQDVYAEDPSTPGQYLAFERTVSTTSQKGIYSLYMGMRANQSSFQGDPAASDAYYLQFEGYEPEGEMDKLLEWDFSQKRAKLLLQEARPPRGYHSIMAGNSRWALWEGYGMGSSGSVKFSHLIDRQNGLIYTYPDRELFWEGFALLQPDYLYNVNDTKFYTIGPTLTKRSEPEDLYPHPGNHIGWDFHIVGR